MKDKFFKVPSPVLKAKEGQVIYPVSIRYNGLIEIEGKLYNGYKEEI